MVRQSRSRLLGVGLTVLALVATIHPATATGGRYLETTPSRDGIGKRYMGREISRVMGHRGARWLERPSRVREELPELVVEHMELQPAQVVADIGAGTGYFTLRISSRLPEGRVYAVDIQQEMLDILRRRLQKHSVKNVVPVLATVTDPGLPPNSLDAALLVDAYHEFSHPFEVMQGVAAALKPGGRLFLVEYRGEDRSVPIKPLHKMTEAQARREMAAVGLRWRKTLDFLPTQHFMVFDKPPEAD
ncbi:MAG: class I SAM-dependent methyltransferase [Gammaproteobacteria bacterium]|nr:class I SAM-dependent methyltransferase [Gammaproteobacteria bacterium]